MEKRKVMVPKGTTSIEIAFEQADKEPGCVEIPLTDTKHRSETKATGIDILRMRGTPIELIGSCIAAEDWKTAHAAFRTSILEYVYEKIAAYEDCGVCFRNSRDLERVGEQLGLLLDSDGSFATIGLTPEHDTVMHDVKGHAWVCKVESGEMVEKIDDHVTATMMKIIEVLTGNIIGEISGPISAAREKFGKGLVEVHLIVDLFDFKLTITPENITAHIHVPMVAFWAGKN